MDNTNKIIDMYEGKEVDEHISWTEWEDEFTLEIPEGVTKLLYNSNDQGSIYKNQTLADVASEQIATTRSVSFEDEEIDELKRRFNKHIANELSEEAVHITQAEKDQLLPPEPEPEPEPENGGGGDE